MRWDQNGASRCAEGPCPGTAWRRPLWPFYTDLGGMPGSLAATAENRRPFLLGHRSGHRQKCRLAGLNGSFALVPPQEFFPIPAKNFREIGTP
jgi:hypothetical protein